MKYLLILIVAILPKCVKADYNCIMQSLEHHNMEMEAVILMAERRGEFELAEILVNYSAAHPGQKDLANSDTKIGPVSPASPVRVSDVHNGH